MRQEFAFLQNNLYSNIIFFPCREGRQIIEVCGKNIKKTYISPDAHDRVEKLVNIYEKLVQKGVPNVDCLDYADREKDVIYLSPKGMSVKPKN